MLASLWAKIKLAIEEIAAYLIHNPGAATLVGSWVILALAKFGLHVSLGQLYALIMTLLPLVIGAHVAARRVREGSQYLG